MYARPPISKDELHSIMVMKLPLNVTKTMIADSFRKFGRVADVHIPFDKVARKLHDYGFVRFYQKVAMESAMSAESVKVCGKDVVIGHARPTNDNKDKESQGLIRSRQVSPVVSISSGETNITATHFRNNSTSSSSSGRPTPIQLEPMLLKNACTIGVQGDITRSRPASRFGSPVREGSTWRAEQPKATIVSESPVKFSESSAFSVFSPTPVRANTPKVLNISEAPKKSKDSVLTVYYFLVFLSVVLLFALLRNLVSSFFQQSSSSSSSSSWGLFDYLLSVFLGSNKIFPKVNSSG